MIFVPLLLGWILTAEAAMKDCCPFKIVGDVRYKLESYDLRALGKPYNCKSPCVYTSVAGRRFCFGPGDLIAECDAEANFLIENDPCSSNISGIVVYPNTPKVPSSPLMILSGYRDGTSFAKTVSIVGNYCPNVSTNEVTQGFEFGAAAIGFDEGTLYYCGGAVTPTGPYSNNCTMRNLSSGNENENENVPSMNSRRYDFTLTNVGGKLVAVGGMSSEENYLDSVEYLEYNSDQWTPSSTTISPARSYHCAMEFHGYVLIVGGQTNGGEYLSKAEAIHVDGSPAESPFNQIQDLPESTYGASCVRANENHYVIGGSGVNKEVSNQLLILTYDSGNARFCWKSLCPMKYERALFAAGFVKDGELVVLSGAGDGYDVMETYTISTNQWNSAVFSTPTTIIGASTVQITC